MIKLDEIHPGVLLITGDDQHVVNDMFMRPQEFYESPMENIRGKVFSVDQFIQSYGKLMGNFNYHSAWVGFNIPGNILKKFFLLNITKGTLRSVECQLIGLLADSGIAVKDLDNYYIIGTNTSEEGYLDILDHEICHAFWSTNTEFRNKAHDLLHELPSKIFNDLKSIIIEMGYSDVVVLDEMNAYITTSDKEFFEEKFFDINLISSDILEQLKNNFKKAKEQR